ncbi:MAG: hypothetical protein O3C63_01660 [Cyanobacteria bacterium]|nr:hypothetical protein [Cyanobacteriota bacterium]MDA1020017.1 hypothetical protein [Cyanobacteriota bacterium]
MEARLMLLVYCLVLLISLSITYVLVIANSKYLWLNSSYQSQSLLNNKGASNQANIGLYKILMIKFGTLISQVLTRRVLEQLELDYFNLDRTLDEMLQMIGEAFLVFTVLLLVYLVNHNWIFLLLSFVLPALIALEINLALYQYKKELESSVEHLVRCLKVLVIKTETPIINALETIIKDLPIEFKATKRELSKLIAKSTKSGMRQTLIEWTTDLPKFRDFIGLLISVNDGASKHALKLSFDNFLDKMDVNKIDEINNQADNAQLYLMGPVVVMLIIISLPMVDAVRFLMMESL